SARSPRLTKGSGAAPAPDRKQKMSFSIGIDLGGTNIKAVAVTADGEILARASAPTLGEDGAAVASGVARQLVSLEHEVGAPASAAGIASPGLVARDGRSMVS